MTNKILTDRQTDRQIWFWILVLATVIYRLFIIKDYTCKYIDDDQALLWYGTALAGRFGIHEPHFLGQAYGSMLESIVAVPLYWIEVKLNYAVPIATTILWFCPFFVAALYLKRKNPIVSAVILLLPLLNRWDYDILTEVPRSFICGFSFATLGVLAFLDKGKRQNLKLIIAPIIMAIGFVNTETAITVVGIGILFAALYDFKRIISHWKPILVGAVIGLAIIRFCNHTFYVKHNEYMLHGGFSSIQLSIETFVTNIQNNLLQLLTAFSLVNIGKCSLFLILIIGGIIIISCYFHEWRLLVIQFFAIAGTMMFLALPKTLDFYDKLLFSQTRMFLFIPYLAMMILLFVGLVLEPNELFYQRIAKTLYSIALLGVLITIGKTIYFCQYVIEDDSLYESYVVRVVNTADVYAAAEEIANAAYKNDCDIVVMLSDNRALGYATGAVNFNKYDSYNAFYDRRTESYLKYKEHDLSQNVLFVECDGDTVRDCTCKYVDGNLIDYIKNNYGIQRYPDTDARYERTN